jgi:hypothetical protein
MSNNNNNNTNNETAAAVNDLTHSGYPLLPNQRVVGRRLSQPIYGDSFIEAPQGNIIIVKFILFIYFSFFSNFFYDRKWWGNVTMNGEGMNGVTLLFVHFFFFSEIGC